MVNVMQEADISRITPPSPQMPINMKGGITPVMTNSCANSNNNMIKLGQQDKITKKEVGLAMEIQAIKPKRYSTRFPNN